MLPSDAVWWTQFDAIGCQQGQGKGLVMIAIIKGLPRMDGGGTKAGVGWLG